MARSGKESWVKYFQGSMVVTTMKQPHGDLLEGKEVVVNGSCEYSPRVEVSCEGMTYIVPFSKVRKPCSNSTVNLKPQAFVVTDRWISIGDYIEEVRTSIMSRQYTDELKLYLLALIDHALGVISDGEITEVTAVNSNEVKKDFGEVLGPIAIIHNDLIGIGTNSDTEVFFPERGNEPLLDYIIRHNNVEYKISAKAGKTTNVVKPNDVLALLDTKNNTEFNGTKAYQILKELASGTVVSGAISAVSIINDTMPPKAGDFVRGKYRDQWDSAVFGAYVEQNDYLSSSSTLNEIMYEAEKELVKYSKKHSDIFSNIFEAAIVGAVIYINFDIKKNIPQYKVLDEQFAGKCVTLRTKNGYTRRSDRLGYQFS